MNGPRVGVDEELGRIEAETELGSIRAVDAIAIDLTRRQIRNIAVPDVPGALRQGDALGFVRIIGASKETDLNRRGVLGEESKVDARAVPGCTQRERRAGPHPRASPRAVSPRRGFRCQDAHAAASSILSTWMHGHGGGDDSVTEPVSSGQGPDVAAHVSTRADPNESGTSALNPVLVQSRCHCDSQAANERRTLLRES